MQPLLPIIRRLPVMFSQLKASLMAWRDMGHGLGSIRHWTPAEMDKFLTELYVMVGERLISVLPRSISLYHWDIRAPAEVCSGPELLSLLGSLAVILTQPLPNEAESDLLQLTEQLYFSLIGLLHAEEPGELTPEQLLASH
ncbi:hypothetical protein AB6735_14465 [Mucilaginibacter sp. RCC_168]|uniref:hypothetical protein n=1 Tax=Mucilaginibacter sp. RCC_168 TaxID=3239221 RepID=UPI0035250DB3